MQSLEDVTAKPHGLQVTLVGSREAWERYFADCAKKLPKLLHTFDLYKQMTPRDQRRYAKWTPDRLLRHLVTVQTRQRGTGERPAPRTAGRRSAATARAPDRPREPEADEPPPCACGCKLPSRPGSKYHNDAHGIAFRVRRHRAHAVVLTIPVDLAEQAWDAAGGDGFLALDAALAIVARLETVAG
jgi:hypothetical protein